MKQKIFFILFFTIAAILPLVISEILHNLGIYYALYVSLLYVWGAKIILKGNHKYSRSVLFLILLGIATFLMSLHFIINYPHRAFDFTPLYPLTLFTIIHLVVFITFTKIFFKRKKLVDQPLQMIRGSSNDFNYKTLFFLLIISTLSLAYMRVIEFTAFKLKNTQICYLIPNLDNQYECLKIQYFIR